MHVLLLFVECFAYVTRHEGCVFVSLDGVPSCANKRLLTDILRVAWNFTGYVVSDDDALEHIVNSHHYLPTYVEAAAAAVDAGCNLELTGDKSGWVFSYLPQVHTHTHTHRCTTGSHSQSTGFS